MKLQKILPVLSGLLLASFVSQVHSTTIQFENYVPAGTIPINFTPLVVDGFKVGAGLFVVVSSTSPDSGGYGPQSTSDFFSFCTCSTSAYVTREDGQLFSLSSFDVGFGTANYRTFQVVGTKADDSTVIYTSDTLSAYWSHVSFGSDAGFFDLKRVSFVGTGPISVALDNIEVSQVPVPAAAWLFGSALVGLAGARRRTKVNSH